jgi:hypothetical protein
VVRKLGSGVLTVPGTKYRRKIWLGAIAKVVVDFGLYKISIVRKLGSGVLFVTGTKYRIIICVRSYGQGRR